MLISPLESKTEATEEMFKKVFQYEINNRAFAFKSILKLAEDSKGTEQEGFWQAYANMERLSQPKYEVMAEKYNLTVNTTLVNLKSWSINIGMKLFPDKMMSTMTEATIKYVDKLAVLPELGRPEVKDFFNYVVEQEKTQADALILVQDKQYDKAADLINNFIEASSQRRN